MAQTDDILAIILMDKHKNILAEVKNLQREKIAELCQVVATLIGDKIEFCLPVELSEYYIPVWRTMWYILNGEMELDKFIVEMTDGEIYALALLADLYRVPVILEYLSEYVSGILPVNPTTLAAGRILGCVETHLRVAHSQKTVPEVRLSFMDYHHAFALMRDWAGGRFIDITDATWPAAHGIHINTNVSDILKNLLVMSRFAFCENQSDFYNILVVNPNIAFAGGLS